MINDAIGLAVEGKDLSFDQAQEVMNCIMQGEATDAQIASLITALRMKGETIDEIAAFAKVMREKATRISPKSTDLLDTCGTGGDSKGSFNISTAVAFVAAAAGIKVAKHGNRSISSSCGSADVLEALGVNIEIPPEKVAQSIDEVGIGFLYAPMLHSAMKHAIGPRKEIAIRTVFNILGPLTNPANAQYQLLGVFEPKLVNVMAEVLNKLGSKRAAVVHGCGFDEVAVTGDTKIALLIDGKVENEKINPQDYGIKIVNSDEIKGGGKEENAKIIKSILKGEEKGAKNDAVAINAGVVLYIGGKVKDINEGVLRAKEVIDSGKPFEILESMVDFTNK